MSINIPGYAVSNAGAISVQRNFYDYSYPNLAASSIVLKSGENLQIAPSRGYAQRFFVSLQQPVIGVTGNFFNQNDYVIRIGFDGVGRALYQRINGAWETVGTYNGQSALISTAYTLNGGNSDDVDAAIIAAGTGNQLVLTGSFNLSRPVSLDQIGFRGQLEIVFSSATITWNGNSLPAATSVTVTPTNYPAAAFGEQPGGGPLSPWRSNPVSYHAQSGKQSFVRDLLLNASFK
jgi:hypothetical protein